MLVTTTHLLVHLITEATALATGCRMPFCSVHMPTTNEIRAMQKSLPVLQVNQCF